LRGILRVFLHERTASEGPVIKIPAREFDHILFPSSALSANSSDRKGAGERCSFKIFPLARSLQNCPTARFGFSKPWAGTEWVHFVTLPGTPRNPCSFSLGSATFSPLPSPFRISPEIKPLQQSASCSELFLWIGTQIACTPMLKTQLENKTL